MIDTKCVIVCRLIVIKVKHAECGLHEVHAPDNLNDVLQVYIAILPIYNNAYKFRNSA